MNSVVISNKRKWEIVSLILLIIYNSIVCFKYNLFEIFTDASIANKVVIHFYVVLVLSVVFVVNIIKIIKLTKNPNETKIKEYEAKGPYGRMGKWIIALGIIIEIALCVKCYKFFWENNIFYPIVDIIYIAICYKYFYKPKQNMIKKIIYVSSMCLFTYCVMAITVGSIMWHVAIKYGFGLEKTPSVRFELSDKKSFGGEWKEMFCLYGNQGSFLLHVDKCDLGYDDSNPYPNYNFTVYYTKCKWINSYLVKKAFGDYKKDNQLYGAFAGADEIKELEKADVKVFNLRTRSTTNTTEGYTIRNGMYLIYDENIIIYLKCNYKLTENQVDVIIDSMKSMEDKL